MPGLRVFAVLLASISTAWACGIHAQGFEFLADRPIYTPFAADIRAPQISIMAIGVSDEFPFVQNPGRRAVWDIGLGKEIPVISYLGTGGGWGVTWVLPVGFYMIEDFKDDSAPILNTDYRFAPVAVKLQVGNTDYGWSWGLRWIPWAHESTHLGDEFSLAAEGTYDDFIRVNVSYEYMEGSALLQHVSPTWSFRGQVGALAPIHSGNGGFYSYDLRETNNQDLTLSEGNWEAYAAAEALPISSVLGRFGLMASIEARSRLIYNYFQTAEVGEGRQISWNLVVGLRDTERRHGETGVADLFIRFYHGVNPHGQFRSQRGYSLLGIGIRADI